MALEADEMFRQTAAAKSWINDGCNWSIIALQKERVMEIRTVTVVGASGTPGTAIVRALHENARSVRRWRRRDYAWRSALANFTVRAAVRHRT